jgi:hypothetical protein
MAARLSALRAGGRLPSERFLVFISVRGWVDPNAIVRLEGLSKLKNPVTSSGIEPATSGRQYIRMGTRYFQAAYMAYCFSMKLHWILCQCHMKLLTDRWVRQFILTVDAAVFTSDDELGMWEHISLAQSEWRLCTTGSPDMRKLYVEVQRRACVHEALISVPQSDYQLSQA